MQYIYSSNLCSIQGVCTFPLGIGFENNLCYDNIFLNHPFIALKKLLEGLFINYNHLHGKAHLVSSSQRDKGNILNLGYK